MMSTSPRFMLSQPSEEVNPNYAHPNYARHECTRQTVKTERHWCVVGFDKGQQPPYRCWYIRPPHRRNLWRRPLVTARMIDFSSAGRPGGLHGLEGVGPRARSNRSSCTEFRVLTISRGASHQKQTSPRSGTSCRSHSPKFDRQAMAELPLTSFGTRL